MRYSKRNPKMLKFTSREISRRVNKILNFIGLKVIRLSTDLEYQRLSQDYYRDFRSGADIDVSNIFAATYYEKNAGINS